MEKVLNQEEIDAMFRAARGRIPSRLEQGRKIQACNFRQAGQINAEQVQSITALHESFARNLTHWLAAYLRTAFECNLVSVEQIPYREVLSRMPEVAYLATIRLHPIEAIGILQLDLALAFPIIDMLLGGSGISQAPLRDVTEVEEQILEGVVRIICRELQGAWQPLGLEFVFDQRQQPSQMQRIMAPAEMTLSLNFEMRLCETRGTLNLVFPPVVSNALLRKMAKEWTYQRPHASDDAKSRISQLMLNSQFAVELAVPSIRVSARDLLSLAPGQILRLGRESDIPAALLVSGHPMFSAGPVRLGQLRAAKIQNVLSNEGTIERGSAL